ncbi:MAG: pyruvate kinase alpha/beta domain-containing protein [Deferrisomatales bacterium]|nr:pyruvate kinase alpha/beta domain-containing protein [Deferrisomatales bacterium]
MSEITYFDGRGTMNTTRVLDLVKVRAATLSIGTVVIPSTGGATGLLAAEHLSVLDVVVVSHSTGYGGPGMQQMPAATRSDIEAKGARVLTTTHAFGGVGRSVRKKFDTWQVEEIIAQTLKRFGEGTKVAIEVSLMAADAGLIPAHEEIIACGGSGHGLDTALVLKPTHAQTFFDLEVLEIICKPRTP